MITAVILLAIPLALRYMLAQRMRRTNAILLRQEAERQRLKARHEELRDELQRTSSRRRHLEVRRSFLANDIAADRRRLHEFKKHDSGPGRLAA